jgi:uncharacterized SAM-binding protein YcdF (DUF218 family)
MSLSWFITNLLAAFLLPPFSLLILLGAGIALLFRRHKLAKPLIVISFLLLWACATPYVSDSALHLLESRTRALSTAPQEADAIVVLGGGTYFRAPVYAGQDTNSEATLVRLRYAAKLQHDTGKPILVTGGKPLGNTSSEAQQMRATLELDFKTPVRWIEDASDNTFENARYSHVTLQQAGIRKIYLVTHAWHMPRAAEIFRRVGFEVIEAPTAFTTRYQTDLLTFLPRAEAARDSKIFVHEAIGLLWYRLKS